jgi:K+-sensing histidine kinase KdpD
MPAIEQIPQLPVPEEKRWQGYLIDSLLAVGGALAITGIIYAYHLYPTIPNISIVYLLLILALASTRGRYAAILASVVAFLSFDFFLVPPFYTLVISHWEDWIALFVFLVTALITSQLATTSRQSVEQARLREREARILFEVGRVINSTDRIDEQLDSIVLSLVRVFYPWGVRECALLLPDKNGMLSIAADAPVDIESFILSPAEMAAVDEVMAQGKIWESSRLSSGTQSVPAGQSPILLLIPLKAGSQVLGVLGLHIEHGVSWFESKQRMQEEQQHPSDQSTFFWTFLDQAILVIEQERLRTRRVSNHES